MSVLFLIGKTLGKYQIVEHIGHGGMAEVYKARHVQLDRMVAIKVLHPFLADESGFVARFRREAKIVATLRHQNIVRVYDFDYDEDLDIYYMVMEYIEGESLKKRLESGPLAIGEALSITAAIADALDYAHQRGMVHRDIKPANILFTTENIPVLTDFGIARMLSVTGLTASGAMVGTPAYMAPEVGMGDPGSVASDVYSLGVVLFEMLTGRPPFVSETAMGVIMQHINEPVPALSQFIAHPLPALETVLQKCLAKRPEERYATAQELAQHVRLLLSNADTFGGSVNLPEGIVFVEDWARITAPLGGRNTTSPTARTATPPPSPTQEDLAPVPEAAPSEVAAPEAHDLPPTRALEDVAELPVVEDAPSPLAPSAPRRRLGWLIGAVGVVALLLGALALGWQTGRLSAWLGGLPLPLVTATATIPPEVLFTPTVTPTPAPTVTRTPLACRYRITIDNVTLRPADSVPPNIPLAAFVMVSNNGNCPLPAGGRLRLQPVTEDPRPQEFTLAALEIGASQLAIIPLPAPEGGGVFTRTVTVAWDNPVEVQSALSFTYRVDPTVALVLSPQPTPTATPSLVRPLEVRAPVLVDWREDLTQGVWYGTLRLQLSGGDGAYRVFFSSGAGESPLPGTELSFAWRRCQAFPLTLRVISGAEEVIWNGSIP